MSLVLSLLWFLARLLPLSLFKCGCSKMICFTFVCCVLGKTSRQEVCRDLQCLWLLMCMSNYFIYYCFEKLIVFCLSQPIVFPDFLSVLLLSYAEFHFIFLQPVCSIALEEAWRKLKDNVRTLLIIAESFNCAFVFYWQDARNGGFQVMSEIWKHCSQEFLYCKLFTLMKRTCVCRRIREMNVYYLAGQLDFN